MIPVVTSRDFAHRACHILSENNSVAVISITNPGSPKVTGFIGLANVVDYCSLSFHDVDKKSFLYSALTNVQLFNKQMAEWIGEFLLDNKMTDYILIHCEQGTSRSPAIAMAIDKWNGNPYDHWRINYAPNNLVFELMSKVMERDGFSL